MILPNRFTHPGDLTLAQVGWGSGRSFTLVIVSLQCVSSEPGSGLGIPGGSPETCETQQERQIVRFLQAGVGSIHQAGLALEPILNRLAHLNMDFIPRRGR